MPSNSASTGLPCSSNWLYDVYHSGWFLTILAFLVLSTTLCIVRNGPGFIKDMKAYREKASDNSLAAMKHSVEMQTRWTQIPCAPICVARAGAGANTSAKTAAWCWQPKGAQQAGLFLAHIALVVICIGGLMDGNLPLKLAEMVGSVVPETATSRKARFRRKAVCLLPTCLSVAMSPLPRAKAVMWCS
jgi:cytochrome c biogenesis protein